MKNFIILFSLVTLHSCETLEHFSEQCSPFFVYADESKKMVDADKSACLCRKYQFSENYIGPISGSSVEKPLDYCHKVVGFKDYVPTATFWEEVRRAIVDHEGEHFVNEIGTHDKED